MNPSLARPLTVFALLPVLLLLLVSPLSAETVRIGRLAGTVIDARTREPVPSATVTVLGRQGPGALTDDKGRFTLDSVPAGGHQLDIRAAGYGPRIVPTVLVKQGVNMETTFEMQRDQSIPELDKLVVTSRTSMTKKSDQVNSVTRLSRDELSVAPGAIDDINKMLQALPSVTGEAGAGGNDFMVRGGLSNENSFIIDGIEVNNLSHWGTEFASGGAISMLHPDFIDGLDFYAGGFPASLPPQLSSIADIRFREGSMTDRRWQIDLGIAGAGLYAEGPFARDKASYMINGRVSFLDIIEPLINVGGLPKYQNGQTKLVWNLNDANKLSLVGLVGHEQISIDEAGGHDHVSDEGLHAVGGLSWFHRSQRGSNRAILTGKYDRFIERSARDDSVTYWKWNNRHSTLQFKDDAMLPLRQADMAMLGFVVEGKKSYDMVGNDEYFIYADTLKDSSYVYTLHPRIDSMLLPITRVEENGYDSSLTGYRLGGYANYSLVQGRFKVLAGLRDDYYTVNRKHGLSPRAAISCNLRRAGEVSLSGGLYYQYPTYVTRLTDYADAGNLPLERNIQGVLGYSKQLSDVVVMGAETYYKHYDREPVYRLEDGSRIMEAGTSQKGVKRAYGVEVYVQKKRLDRFYYQLSYSHTRAQRRYADRAWHEDENSLRNAAKAVLGSNINRHHRVSARLDFTEGAPYTPIDKQASMTVHDTRFDLTHGWNGERRKPRFILSMRYDLTFYVRRATVTAYMEVENALNHRDVVAQYYSLGDKYGEGAIKEWLGRGILPLGGLQITF